MYKPLSERARKVLQLANEEARRLGHEWVGTEYLLLGLVAEGERRRRRRQLKKLDVDLRNIPAEVEWIVQAESEAVAVERPPNSSSQEGYRVRHRRIAQFEPQQCWNRTPAARLVARDGEGFPTQVLLNLNLKLEKVPKRS